MAFADPLAVAAMRARLAPAFASIGAGSAPGSERARVAAEGLAWCGGAPCGLLEAPAALEHGRDLEARLAVLQGGGAPRGGRTSAGEVLGMHTVAELADLLAAERYQLAQFDAIKACPAWAEADPAGYGAWAADVFDASAKLAAAIETAQSVVDFTPAAIASVTPARAISGPLDLWQSLLDAAHPFVDLCRRFMVAGFCPMPSMAGMPQPKAPDLDLRAYIWTDAAAKKIESAAGALGGTGKGILIGAACALGLFVFVKIAR